MRGMERDVVTGTEQQKTDRSFLSIRFECDLKACRGACCTMPGLYGAPLRSEEIPLIQDALPVVEKYLPERHREEIHRRGFRQGSEDHYTTVCVESRACVFVTYENDIALCAFEKAYAAGELSWRKPLSCHLFPLREKTGTPGDLRFERIPECQPALDLGEERGTPLIDFLRSALIRFLGDEGYDAIRGT